MGIGVVWKIARQARSSVLLVLLGLWLIGGGAGGRSARAQAVKGQIISVGIGGVGGGGGGGVYREGCWVPVQVRLRNVSGQPFTGHLAVDQDLVDLDGDKLLAIGPEFTLAPGVDERTLWTYYWPRPDYSNFEHGISRIVVLDKDRAVMPDATLRLPEGTTPTDIGPVDYTGSRHSARFAVVLGHNFGGWRGFEGLYGGTEAIRPVLLNGAGQLPDRVLGYDGVDVIYWQADAVKLNDLSPPEFTLNPILEWVKSGGHLIISVSSPEAAQAFARADEKFRALLPVTFSGENRDLKGSDVGSGSLWGVPLADQGNPATLIQSLTTLKADGSARVVLGDAPGSGGLFAEHPLAATGLCGRGAITVLTFDPSAPEFQLRLSDRQWVNFWNQMAGWRQNDFAANFRTQVDYNKLSDKEKEAAVSIGSAPIRLGELTDETSIQQAIDVTDVTLVRVAVALLFLAIYWLLAGPVGHLILRAYKIVHWSWWVFGGMVVLATGVAGAVVLVMHVSNYEVRHRSFVLGVVTPEGQQGEATVASFYGIYAPVSGLVPVSQPPTPGLNYLAPLCLPSEGDVKSFADPQSYTLNPDKPWELSPVFRNTLKKLQGRWNGPLAGVTGSAAYSPGSDLVHPLAGKLTNHSGYDLHDADVLVYLPHLGRTLNIDDRDRGSTYLYHISDHLWKNGETVDLQTQLGFDALAMGSDPKETPAPGTMEMALEAMGWKFASTSYTYYVKSNAMTKGNQLQAIENMSWRTDFLYLLADARNNDLLTADDRRELSRGIGRMTDCTKALHAAGALIVAHAEDVRSPVALSVNGKQVEGKGAVTFAWALPVGGSRPASYAVPAAPAKAGAVGSQPKLLFNPEGQ